MKPTSIFSVIYESGMWYILGFFEHWLPLFNLGKAYDIKEYSISFIRHS